MSNVTNATDHDHASATGNGALDRVGAAARDIGAKGKDVAAAVKATAVDARDKVIDVKDKVVDGGAVAKSRLRRFAGANPVASIAIAAAVALVGGYVGMRMVRMLRA